MVPESPVGFIVAALLVLVGMTLILLADPQARLEFGAGPHACPGDRIALAIAATALRTLEEIGALQRLAAPQGYRPLPNARIPRFAA
jgi:2-polyprenyl-6-methoxyphenol hydroxylase-like FAD-dependent oxidoreductase